METESPDIFYRSAVFRIFIEGDGPPVRTCARAVPHQQSHQHYGALLPGVDS